MKIVYASRNGHVEGIVNRLGIKDAIKIVTGDEKVDDEFVLFTYTDGQGIVPPVVDKFLKANKTIKAVVGSGNSARHPTTFNFAVDKIADEFDVPIIARVDGDGTERDLSEIKNCLEKL